MIQAYKNYFLILIISFVYSEGSWWPDKCNYSDTIITGSDTSITRYICKENGRKEILKEKNGKYHGKYTAWSSNGEKIEEFSYYNDEIDGEVKGWVRWSTFFDSFPSYFKWSYPYCLSCSLL